MSEGFAEQVAIVTGAGSAQGIGFAVARRLLAVGARIAITSTTERIHERARELDATGTNVWSAAADLTEPSQVRELVKGVLQRFARIDILVNNAGMAQTGRALPSHSLEDSSFNDWSRQIEITLFTAYLMIREVLPTMRSRGYGRIVNVSSVTGP